MRHIWRVISTVEVLPLVPVTATDDLGIGREEFRRELGEQPPRLGVGEVRHAARPAASGRATTATAPRVTACADEILAVEHARPGTRRTRCPARPCDGRWQSP